MPVCSHEHFKHLNKIRCKAMQNSLWNLAVSAVSRSTFAHPSKGHRRLALLLPVLMLIHSFGPRELPVHFPSLKEMTSSFRGGEA